MNILNGLSRWAKPGLGSVAIGLVGLWSASALATDVAVRIGGEIKPGVYGRIDIGTRPPPPVLYPQPVVIIAPPRQAVPVTPVYMHVPPGHAKKWDKHCHQYNACGQSVYFVKSSDAHGYSHAKHKRHKHDD